MRDMNGKIVIVTGANGGIGKIAAHELAKMGATVIMVARSKSRGNAALAEIKAAIGGGDNISLMLCDLSSQASIRAFAGQFMAKYDRLDVLLNNAGVMFMDRLESVDGYEMTFALNHMGYFLLTDLLLDLLKASGNARIINVASDAHRVGLVNFDDLQRQQGYSGMRVYGESKLMNILYTFELARRLEETAVTVNTLHPGFVRTNFGRNNGGFIGKILMPLAQLGAINANKGAETSIYLAASDEVEGVSGKYFVKKKSVQANDPAYDEAAQKQLWAVSEAALK